MKLSKFCSSDVISISGRKTIDCTNPFTSINVCENQIAMSIVSTAITCVKGTERKSSILHCIITMMTLLQNGPSGVQKLTSFGIYDSRM